MTTDSESSPETPEQRHLKRARWVVEELEADLGKCESMRDRAALWQRYLDAISRVEQLEKALPAPKGTALDEFTRRRAERETSGPPLPAKRQQRGR